MRKRHARTPARPTPTSLVVSGAKLKGAPGAPWYAPRLDTSRNVVACSRWVTSGAQLREAIGLRRRGATFENKHAHATQHNNMKKLADNFGYNNTSARLASKQNTRHSR